MLDDLAMMLQCNQLLYLALVGVIGLCVGSFLNVVIYRIPLMLDRGLAAQTVHTVGQEATIANKSFNLLFPSSHCPHCKTSISAFSNIPIFSFLFLGGRSACCQQGISLRYPLTEILTMGLSVFIAFHYGVSWECLAALAFTWALIVLAFIDYDHKILPDNITIPLIWVGLMINTFQLFTTPENALFGAAAGYLIFWTIAYLYKCWRKIEGLGQGDFKLLAACGAWLGLQFLPLVILLSSLLGSVFGLINIIVFRRPVRAHIPFGPFIAIAAFVAMIWGPALLTSL
jgi:leader peptidase (prepilin peptidase)/N-methyltransferase